MYPQSHARTPASAKFLTRPTLFATAGASALLAASSAYAQEPAAPAIESVTVSSSRIMSTGFNAPTPTTVVSSDFLQNQAKDNVFTAITELPSMMGSTGIESNVNGTSGGTNGLASFNMFGLGTIRTLTLVDGERFMPANVTGVPDIDEFPQMLIQRVDVVTGGASASWGSDAVAGVVNFIIDKNFNGFKANISSGLSTYNDNATATIQAAAGTGFAGGKGHFEVSVDYSHSDGVQGGWQQLSCCGNSLTNSLTGGRTWFSEPTILQYGSPTSIPNGTPGTATFCGTNNSCQPQYFVTSNGQQNQLGRYGLITTGPLQGTAFGPNGTTYPFNYGVGPNGVQGVPNHDGTPAGDGTVKNCIVAFCIGGETDGQTGSGVTLATPITRGDVFTRLSYDITPNVNVYLTLNWSQVGTSNIPNPDMWLGALPGITGGTSQAIVAGGGISAAQAAANLNTILTSSNYSTGSFNAGQLLQAPGIQCGNAAGGANPFLPASVNAACIANNTTEFGIGSLYFGLGPQVVYTQRDNRRLVGGATGTFNLIDTDWTWKGYYEHGENDTNIHVRGIALKPYMYAAIDSVQVSAANQATYPNAQLGEIVCRSAVADAEGCVPFDPFGPVNITQAQKNWIYGGANWGPGPLQLSHQMQDVADFAISGSPISDWAGKVSVATGFTWRQEVYDVRGDGAGNGTLPGADGAPGSPCTDPVLNCANGVNWYAGSFHNANGYYHVLEGFVEFNVPLLDSPAWGTANLDISGRHARYSTAGDANTWKVGGTWDTPLDGLRLRALQSRDIRAPNLSELFAAPVTANGSATDPCLPGTNPCASTSLQVINGTYGNSALKPERSVNSQLGVVYQPSWLQGFNASIDYYRLYIAGEITTIPVQTNVNNCFAGLTQYCSLIVVPPGTTPQTTVNWLQANTQFLNVASVVTDGFNYEADYQFNLNDWGLLPVPGSFTLRALATNVSKFITNPGVPGGIVVHSAGGNQGNTPHWKAFLVQTYNADNWQMTLSETWISEGQQNMNWIQCTAGSCPAPTLTNPTVNDNHVPGIYYINLGGSYNINDHLQLYTQIDNLLNKSPPADPSNSQNPAPANPVLYDTIGRMFHVGVRIND